MRALALLAMLLLAAVGANGQPADRAGTQTARALVRDGQALRYLLYLPAGYHAEVRRWPLVLFLHGAGERGDSLDLVKKHGPPKLIAAGQRFPFLVVSPQLPAGERWDPAVLSELLDRVVAQHRVDEARVYVTGLSMGGFGTWALATAEPDRFAAIAPICGWGDPDAVCALRAVPTWAFHGAKDDVVPLGRSEELVEALEACGGDVRLTVYPDAGHDSWTETYDNPELYDWLLRHRRATD